MSVQVAVVGEIHLELVGGPLDGAERYVSSICDCCGKEVVPGTVIAERVGRSVVSYEVNSNRCYAYFKEERQVA